MSKQQRKTLISLVGVFLLYFVAFIPANLKGARDPVMISIFEPDEFAQYSIPRDMLTRQDTPKQTIYNFIAYDHYYYGFPFYLSSIAATFPQLLHGGWTNHNTQETMLLLRQLVNVFPMCVAVGLLVFTVTRFRSLILSNLLAIFILTVPAVVENNLWWHPDSLVMVFIIATLAALMEDRFRLGIFFKLAAIACGLAVGTKVLGFFFFLTIPIYLLMGFFQKQYDLKRMVLSSICFVGLLFATILISNPYLLIPSEFNQMVQIMTRQSAAQSAGWTLTYDRGPYSWLPIISRLYGSLSFWLVCFGCLIYTIWIKQTRSWGWLLLSWIAPLSVYILFFTAIKPTHFLLPVAIPMFSVLIQPWLSGASENERGTYFQRTLISRISKLALAAILLVQFGINLSTDIHIYQEKLSREEKNPVIQFYDLFSEEYGDLLTSATRVKVMRDVRAYFPASGNVKVSEFYNTLTDAQLQKKKPDLLILWNQRIRDYSTLKSKQNAIDPAAYEEIHRFFIEAKNDQIPGYQLLMENQDVKAFVSSDFAQLIAQSNKLE